MEMYAGEMRQLLTAEKEDAYKKGEPVCSGKEDGLIDPAQNFFVRQIPQPEGGVFQQFAADIHNLAFSVMLLKAVIFLVRQLPDRVSFQFPDGLQEGFICLGRE